MKILSCLFLFAATLFFGSCSKYTPYLYQITDITLLNINNRDNIPVLDTTGTIAAKTYAIQLQYTTRVTGHGDHTVPHESDYALQSKVNSFKIYSSTDFDSNHSAGASLNDLFLYGVKNTQALQIDTIGNAQAKGYFLSAYQPWNETGTNKPWQNNAYFVLTQPPAIPGRRTFIIDLLFADTTHFVDSTSITLN